MAPCFWDIITSKPSQQTKVGNTHKHTHFYIYLKNIVHTVTSNFHLTPPYSFLLFPYLQTLFNSNKSSFHVFLILQVTREYQLPHYKGTDKAKVLLDTSPQIIL